MISYPARFQQETDGGYSVFFIDLPGCMTQGDSREDARRMTQEALTGYLEVIDQYEDILPEPTHPTAQDIEYISPDIRVAFAIELRKERLQRGLSQEKMAKSAGIKTTQYQRLEDPHSANPTLSTIDKIQKALGCTFIG